MRIEYHETSWNRGRVGAATAIGCGARPLGPYANGCCDFSWRPSQQRLAVDAGVPRKRHGRSARPRPGGKTAQVVGRAGTRGIAVVSPIAERVRLSNRTLDGKHFHVRFHPRYVCQWLAERRITPQKPVLRSYKRDDREVRRWLREEWPRIKKVRGVGVPTSS